MDSSKTTQLRAHLLQKGVSLAEDHPEIRRDLISLFSSLESFQKKVQDCTTRSEALNKLQEFLHNTGYFNATAYYLVNEDMEFVLHYDAGEMEKIELGKFMQEHMRSGQFAWALQQNQPIFLNAPETLPSKHVMLHGMSTRSSTLGMFIGFFPSNQHAIKPVVSHMISLMIDATVFVLENQQLQNELRDQNQKLEVMVNERTSELRHANQFLHHSNQELKRLNEKKSEFLGIAAHDLKNPLSGIIGLAQLIQYSMQDRDESGLASDIKMLSEIEKSANHMIHIISDLINAEALNTGNIKINQSPNNLGIITHKVVALNQPRASEKSIDMEVSCENDVNVMADTIKIQEVVDNLVSNAIKYSPYGSRVKVAVRQSMDLTLRKQVAHFSIKDEGPGLSDDDKSRLFGRFEKLSARPTGGESSTGLGLSIAKTIVELHKGKIWAESEIGKGSTFCFEIPM